MRTALAGLLAAAIVGGPSAVAVASPSGHHAPDRRPCVSNREFNSLKANTPRAVLEQRWEVRDLGVPYHELIGRMVAYPWCSHGSIDKAYVAVQYRHHGLSGWSLEYNCRWEADAC